jgi:hypothetical protein
LTTGCISSLFLIALVVVIYFVRDNAKYVTSKRIDNSKPHNWVIIEDSGKRWTTYSLAKPNVRREQGKATYVYSLDEVHGETICGDKCTARVCWKYNGGKIVKDGFSKVVRDYDDNIVVWGDTPAGINESLRRIGNTFWKDTTDGITERYFFAEKQVRQRSEHMPIDIISIEYRDLRRS